MGTHEGPEKTSECLHETIGGDPPAIEKRPMMGLDDAAPLVTVISRRKGALDYCYL